MSNPEIVNTTANIDNPFTIFKIGVLGCAPLDFVEKLAEDYDADYVSSDLIRKTHMDAADAEGVDIVDAQNVPLNLIRSIVKAQVIESLEDDHDVAIDMFFNGIGSRRMPIELARQYGALTVGLWINTPFRVALDRVMQWTDEDSFVVPVSRWEIPPIHAAKKMMNHVEWPSHEGIDYVFNLDGEGDTDDLLEQFDDKLAHYGLFGRYETN